MRIYRLAAAFCLGVTWMSPATAGEEAPRVLRPEDFAYGLQIDAPPGGPVYSLELSEEVYRGVTRGDLGDLRVFNAKGDVVPHTLQHRTLEQQHSSRLEPIQFFPIEGAPARAAGGNSIEVREDSSGKVVNVRFSGKGSIKEGPTRAYLLDLRDRKESLASLELDWATGSPNRILSIRIEASDDLRSWSTLAEDAVLAKLSFRSQALEQKRIDLPTTRNRYLKITWDDGADFVLKSIRGELVSGQTIESKKSFARVTGIEAPEKDAKPGEKVTQFLFDTQALFPVSSVRLVLPEVNTFLGVRLISASTREGARQERYSGTVYRVALDGKELESPAIRTGFVTDRYWYLKLTGAEIPVGSGYVLEQAWVPHRLLFLARGEGPFRLAFGSATAPGATFGFDNVLEDLRAARGGHPVKPVEARLIAGRLDLGGAAKLEAPKPETKPPFRQWALWAALAIAVMLVAAMAMKLYREMSQSAAK